MADNPYVNKVETADGDTLMDITDTTAEAGDVVSGEVFYASSGARTVGTLNINDKADKADTVLTTTLSRGRKENTTVGTSSIAFGDIVTASAANSTAIGSVTTASGFCSVAEGDNTTASGYYSHAQGSHTIAQRSSQFVFGEFNVADTEGNSGSYSGKYIEIVGNGESIGRSNARALDWDGNEYLKGDLYVKCDFDSLNGIKVDPRGTKSLTVQLDTVTNTSGSYSHTTSNELVTENMKPVQIECSDSAVFRGDITITTGNGTVTLACSNVVGTSSVSVVLMKEVDNTDPPTVTSSEFDILANRIGTLSSLTTTEKSNLVGAINELLTPVEVTSQITFNEDYNVNRTHFFKIGNMVHFSYMGEAKTHANNEEIFTLPDGLKPAYYSCVPFTVNALAYGNIFLMTNGTVNINQVSDNTVSGRIYMQATYLLA